MLREVISTCFHRVRENNTLKQMDDMIRKISDNEYAAQRNKIRRDQHFLILLKNKWTEFKRFLFWF
jgi:hypothetical protein